MKPVFTRSRNAPLDGGGIDRLLSQGAASFRRRIIAGATVAVLLLAGISIILAWRQYEDGRTRATKDLEARVVAVSAIVDASFAGQIATLTAIAQAPSVVSQDSIRMNVYFARVNPKRAPLFSGGLGWIDRKGYVLASSTRGTAGNLSKRLYFRHVLETGKPYVSAGLIGKRLKQPIVVVAVPTRDQRGRIMGVLAGSILLQTVAESKQALDLGYGDLQIIDRNGHLLLAGLDPVQNRSLLTRIKATGTGEGVLANSSGVDSRGNEVVAFATSKVPGWVTLIDRPRSEVFAAAYRALVLELASMAAGVLLIR